MNKQTVQKFINRELKAKDIFYLKEVTKKERKKTVRSSNSANNYHNAHLKGGDMERIVNEAAAASNMQNE